MWKFRPEQGLIPFANMSRSHLNAMRKAKRKLNIYFLLQFQVRYCNINSGEQKHS